MNSHNKMTSGDHVSPIDENAEIAAFFDAAATAREQQAMFGRHAPAAALRLAQAVYGHDNSQAQTVASCLASVYNGGDAAAVRLDEIRWLDWQLQRDLMTVIVGTGHAGFNDTDIRKAFETVAGGSAGADFLHWHTTGGRHRAALHRVIGFIRDNPDDRDSRAAREVLRSICDYTVKICLSSMTGFEGQLRQDLAVVCDGVFGCSRGNLRPEEVRVAMERALLRGSNRCQP